MKTPHAYTNALFYVLITLIWGSTWLAIQYQVTDVPPIWSIMYRLLIAFALFFVIVRLMRLPLRYPLRTHRLFLMQGLCLFSLNYYCFYLASTYLLSGLVALLFSSITLFNLFNSRWILGTPIRYRECLGIIIGIMGLAIVLFSENTAHHGVLKPGTTPMDLWKGVGFCLLASYLASIGTVLSYQINKLKIPIFAANTFNVLYGIGGLLVLALCMHVPPQVDFSLPYVESLLYLSVLSTVIAYTMYVPLVGRIGPINASYIFILTPILSLLLSTWVEGLHWTAMTVVGTFLALSGNLLIFLKGGR